MGKFYSFFLLLQASSKLTPPRNPFDAPLAAAAAGVPFATALSAAVEQCYPFFRSNQHN